MVAREQQGVKDSGGDVAHRGQRGGGCPLCGGALKARDKVNRHTRTETGKKVWHRIRRLKCLGCGKLHRELLESMLPYKHYCAETIEGVLDDKLQECWAENSTLNRWIAWFAAIRTLLDQRLRAIRIAASGLLYPLVGEHSPLEGRRKRGGGWLADSMRESIHAGYPAYAPSLRIAAAGAAVR